MNIMHLNL